MKNKRVLRRKKRRIKRKIKTKVKQQKKKLQKKLRKMKMIKKLKKQKKKIQKVLKKIKKKKIIKKKLKKNKKMKKVNSKINKLKKIIKKSKKKGVKSSTVKKLKRKLKRVKKKKIKEKSKLKKNVKKKLIHKKKKIHSRKSIRKTHHRTTKKIMSQKRLVKKIESSKSVSTYLHYLKKYQKEIRTYSKKKGCLSPPAPFIKRKASPTIRACTEGYKTGFSQGKNWALLISRAKGSKSQGITQMKCLRSFLTQKNTIYFKCSLRGMKEGYEKYWALSKNPKRLKAYEVVSDSMKCVEAQNRIAAKDMK